MGFKQSSCLLLLSYRPTEQKLCKMTSSSNLRYENAWLDKLSEITNQEFKTQGTKYQVLQNFGICCRELGGSKLRVFAHAFAISALSSRSTELILLFVFLTYL